MKRKYSLEFTLSFGYNPLVLQRAERGFLVALEITASTVSFSQSDLNLA